MAIPEILVIKLGVNDADIEVRGIQGVAIDAHAGLCVGLRGTVPEAGDAWLGRACSVLAASEATLDFALSLAGRDWLLWRAYGAIPKVGDAQALGQASVRLLAHASFAGYVSRLGARPQRGRRLPPGLVL